ncbi:MAG: hypothetical protein V1872_13150 [bacterium]
MNLRILKKKKVINAASCLTRPALYEVKVKNKKIAGSAQRRWQNTILQQGFIIFNSSSKKLFDYVLFSDEQEKIYKQKGSHITSLKEILDKEIDRNTLINALLLGFEEILEVIIVAEELTSYEKGLAESLTINKYKSWEWTFN